MAIILTHSISGTTKAPALTFVLTVPVAGVPAGSVIFVSVAAKTFAGVTTCTVSDNKNSAYDEAILNTGNNDVNALFYHWNGTIALVSGDTITVTFGAVADAAVAVSAMYATGLLTSSDPHDASGTVTPAVADATPIVTTSGNVSEAGELILALMTIEGPTGDAFTQDTTHQGGFIGGGLDTGVAPQRTGTLGAATASNVCLHQGAVLDYASSGAPVSWEPTVGTRFKTMLIATFKAEGTAPPTAVLYNLNSVM